MLVTCSIFCESSAAGAGMRCELSGEDLINVLAAMGTMGYHHVLWAPWGMEVD